MNEGGSVQHCDLKKTKVPVSYKSQSMIYILIKFKHGKKQNLQMTICGIMHFSPPKLK